MTVQKARILSPADLGTALQQARLAKEWSQRDLAENTGIAQSAISQMESEQHTIYAERLFTLLDACGVALSAEWEDSHAAER